MELHTLKSELLKQDFPFIRDTILCDFLAVIEIIEFEGRYAEKWNFIFSNKEGRSLDDLGTEIINTLPTGLQRKYTQIFKVLKESHELVYGRALSGGIYRNLNEDKTKKDP